MTHWSVNHVRSYPKLAEMVPANSAVVAESFGRIYFRNSIAIAFPNVVCPGVTGTFEEGENLELDLATARVRNVTRGIELQGRPYAPEMLRIIDKGGLLNVLKEWIARQS